MPQIYQASVQMDPELQLIPLFKTLQRFLISFTQNKALIKGTINDVGTLTSVAALASSITFYIAVAHYFLEERFKEEAGKPINALHEWLKILLVTSVWKILLSLN